MAFIFVGNVIKMPEQPEKSSVQLRWEVLPFADMDVKALYQWLQLRSEIFVVEQRCIFLDMDGKDQEAYQLLGWKQELLVAGARVLAPGAHHPCEIGRVAVRASHRGQGLGGETVQRALSLCADFWPEARVAIAAQAYLRRFYERLGFTPNGVSYLWDGIVHVDMYR